MCETGLILPRSLLQLLLHWLLQDHLTQSDTCSLYKGIKLLSLCFKTVQSLKSYMTWRFQYFLFGIFAAGSGFEYLRQSAVKQLKAFVLRHLFFSVSSFSYKYIVC